MNAPAPASNPLGAALAHFLERSIKAISPSLAASRARARAEFLLLSADHDKRDPENAGDYENWGVTFRISEYWRRR